MFITVVSVWDPTQFLFCAPSFSGGEQVGIVIQLLARKQISIFPKLSNKRIESMFTFCSYKLIILTASDLDHYSV